jgi:hypothetical protein
MYMPRLSLYRPHKSADYNFLDRTIQEEFSIGGVDVNIHKYLGPKAPEDGTATPDQPAYDVVDETTIQDLLFLENRDRKYDQDIYTVRGVYTLIDNDFNLNQFGIFLANDVIYLTVHINSSVKTIGRKIISGDVVELPHLKDEYALNDLSTALKRYYVVEEVTRPSEGFSQTWYPHLYRLKLKQIYNSQEFQDIFDLPVEEGSDQTLGDILSTYQKEIEINDAILAQANLDARLSGFDTSHYYTLQLGEDGKPELVEVDGILKNQTPVRSGYEGYLLGDGLPPNGEAFGHGISFPQDNQKGDYFLRTDFMPNRLFRYDGTRWVKVEDAVRHTLNNGPDRKTLKGSFINNTNTNEICGEIVEERQSLSKALRPRADN